MGVEDFHISTSKLDILAYQLKYISYSMWTDEKNDIFLAKHNKKGHLQMEKVLPLHNLAVMDFHPRPRVPGNRNAFRAFYLTGWIRLILHQLVLAR